MNKIVILKWVGLKYSGDSIGRNLRIEMEVPNRFLGINKKLSQGKSVNLNQEIGQFLTSQPSFSLPVQIRIIERDPVFKDVGSLQTTIPVDLKTFIHTGRASLGCITILERERWDELYRVLIKARKGDGISIGTLQVVE
ncbi:hypothetical protein WDW89_00220 [Deltaproteobacteria bacterium TL4]